jgi:predicted metal-dependent hydrolase
VLRRWLTRYAQQQLEPWLRRVSVETGLTFTQVTIRGQKSRWGSCSRRRTISLNYKLLFLPPHLVRHVLIHELCHTQHLNHSAKFWALVSQKEPAYRPARVELRSAWRSVPRWTHKEAL